MSVYILDSNFFIQAHRFTYPIDIATGFWTKVEQLANAGTIVSIDKVKNEIFDRNDDLEAWCRAHLPDDFFKDSSEALDQYRQISAWAIGRNDHYQQSAINEFLDADEADAFLISYGLIDTNERIIVTQEVSNPNQISKIKIPDCCQALSVPFVNTIEMFRQLRETF